jgi:hypothetical protein
VNTIIRPLYREVLFFVSKLFFFRYEKNHFINVVDDIGIEYHNSEKEIESIEKLVIKVFKIKNPDPPQKLKITEGCKAVEGDLSEEM